MGEQQCGDFRHFVRMAGQRRQPQPDFAQAGNQRRVQLAVAFAAAPEILMVDEPTNYLDLDSIEALEAGLASWNGTLLVASHDRWLIDHWTGSRLRLEGAADGADAARNAEDTRTPR